MKPTEEREMTYEAILARQRALFEKWDKRKLQAKPKPPTAEQKAQQAFAPTLEAMVKANAQSNQRALDRTKSELEEAERERNEAQYRRNAEIANFQAIELGYAQRQAEALAERRYDPLGSWGPPNYKMHPDD
jgi:hypothetical protein